MGRLFLLISGRTTPIPSKNDGRKIIGQKLFLFRLEENDKERKKLERFSIFMCLYYVLTYLKVYRFMAHILSRHVLVSNTSSCYYCLCSIEEICWL